MICIKLHTSLHKRELAIFCILYQVVALLTSFPALVISSFHYQGPYGPAGSLVSWPKLVVFIIMTWNRTVTVG